MRRLEAGSVAVSVAALILAACGGSGVSPSPTPAGGSGFSTAPTNSAPTIGSITVQGTRAKEPANFADAGETVAVTATVHDDETAADQLQYAWTATAGTFTGTGATVSWIAPAAVTSASTVTISLIVTEKYGANLAFSQSVTGAATLSLHDSRSEVGVMARQFLLDFSDTNIKDVDVIMRNFGGASSCAESFRVQDERDDVIRNYTFYRMINFRVDPPSVTVNFGGTCPTNHGPRKGDACAIDGVMWDSVDTRTNSRGASAGNDFVEAAYSANDSRWWLCASDYQALSSIGNPFSFSR
jgi:hypothetical protein